MLFQCFGKDCFAIRCGKVIEVGRFFRIKCGADGGETGVGDGGRGEAGVAVGVVGGCGLGIGDRNFCFVLHAR